jgi:hypothetical protein
MNKVKLLNQIEKYYWSHKQTIIVDTWEMMDNNTSDCLFDILLADTNIYLFAIQNYNGFLDVDIANKSYFREPKCKIIEIWDGVRAACTPLYFDDTITLKTFKPITKEDIVHATDYFMHEVLGLWLIFNIKFTDKEK